MLTQSDRRVLEERLGEEVGNIGNPFDRFQTQSVAALSLTDEMFAEVDMLGAITAADCT